MTRLTGIQLKKYKLGLKLTEEQREMIIGTILGDASFGGLRDGKPFYGLEFTQSKKHEGYLRHLYEVLKPFVGTEPKERVVGTNKTRDNITVTFKTYRHPCFIFYHNLFCKLEGEKLVKRIPANIDKFLTPRALAYWFMDDGTSTNGTYQFCTDCFSVKEQQLLQNALFKNFNIKVNVTKYKKTHRLTLLAESRETFISVIQPYINKVECMKYKITYPDSYSDYME
jgi:hypothetical protein